MPYPLYFYPFSLYTEHAADTLSSYADNHYRKHINRKPFHVEEENYEFQTKI